MGKRLFIDPGILRDRAVLETGEAVPDGMGGARTDWSPVRDLSVHVDFGRARRRERFDQTDVAFEHRILCRKSDDVQRGRRFRLSDRILMIETVYDPDGAGRYLVCLCREEV